MSLGPDQQNGRAGGQQERAGEAANRSDRRDLEPVAPSRRRFWGAVAAAWLGGVLTHATVISPTLVPRLLNNGDAREEPPFLNEAARYYLSYNGEPLKRLVSIEPEDEKGKTWLGNWAGFSLPDIDAGKRGYRLAGFAHYPIADRRVVVGIYAPITQDASGTLRDKLVLICLTPVGAGESLVRRGFSASPSSNLVKYATNEAILRGTDQKLAVAVVGSASNADLQEVLEQAIADI